MRSPRSLVVLPAATAACASEGAPPLAPLDVPDMEPSALRQIDAFCTPGAASTIITPCNGPCDPE